MDVHRRQYFKKEDMAKKKKVTDSDFISGQDHELDYIKRKYGIGRKVSRVIIKEVNNSRKRFMERIKEMKAVFDSIAENPTEL